VADLHREGEQPDDPPRFARAAPPLPPSPQCRAALERAVHEAARRGDDRLRPEHLLAALLSDPASGAARTLARLGVTSGALAA
jgi:ATP-dependent Clp protease ATP-binding subunit ClpA